MELRGAWRVVVAGLVLLACGAWAQDALLRYHPSGSYSEIGRVNYTVARGQASPQGQLTGEPKYVSAKPVYFQLKLGPKETAYALALDESKGTGEGYDLLYVDANADGDLRDDKPFQGTSSRRAASGSRPSYSSGRFTEGQLLIDYGGEKAPWNFSAYHHTSTSDGKSYVCLHVSTAGYYEGELTLEGKPVRVRVVDANSNGSFNDLCGIRKAVKYPDGRLYVTGDRVLIDVDGDGQFRIQRTGSGEAFDGGRYVLLGEKWHEVTVAPSGRTLSLKQADVPMGTIKRDGAAAFSVGLLSERNGLLTVTSDGESIDVPAGRYTLYSCAFEANDGDGAVWKATGTGTVTATEIDIPAGKLSAAKFGPPLEVGVAASVAAQEKLDAVRPGDSLRLSLTLKGQAGELYSAGDLTRAGKRLPPPTLRIRSEDGNEVATGSFRYG